MPYWRLSGVYFFYFALLGAFLPFWNLYLQGEGYSSWQIGVLGAVFMATRIVAPNIWAWVADSTGHRMQIIRVGAALAALAFMAVLFKPSFAGLMLIFVLYSFFWNAVLAQFEVITLRFLGDGHVRYSRIRVWGSIGFIVAATGLGWVFQHVHGIAGLPWWMLAIMVSVCLLSWSIRAEPEPAHELAGNSWQGLLMIVRQPVVWGFLLVCFLLQLSHGPYYTFYSLYLQELNYDRELIGLLWSLGVAAEVAVFLLMHQLLPLMGVRVVLLASLILATLRWLLIGLYADSLLCLLMAQLLHAASFGTFHSAGIALIRKRFPAPFAGRGQALYSAASFGAGGAAGALMSGMLWNYSHSLTFLMAAAATSLATLVCWVLVQGEKNAGDLA